MSDLISRSELLKEIEKYKFGAISNDAEREYIKNTILDFVICQPTAYDIDKVVEELEKREEHYVEMLDWQGQSAICDAIEIVKQGGVRKECGQMKADGIVRRFDDLGRIVIPKEIRRQLFGTKCTDGEPMEIFMDKYNIILRKYEENETDDVCEWKLDGDMAINPHTFIKYKIKQYDSLYALDTCQYCGKKIKVVE